MNNTVTKQNENNKYEQFNNIQSAYNLMTKFGIPNIKTTDLENDFSFGENKKVNIIEYICSDKMTYSIHLDQPKNLTWLEIWKISDELVLSSGYIENFYIRSFTEDKNEEGKYILKITN